MKKKEPAVDYEALYYRAMKENILLKDKKISFEFSSNEIDFLRASMLEELYDIRDREFTSLEDDSEDNEAMKNLMKQKDVVLNQLVEEKRLMVETIVRKLRFEI